MPNCERLAIPCGLSKRVGNLIVVCNFPHFGWQSSRLLISEKHGVHSNKSPPRFLARYAVGNSVAYKHSQKHGKHCVEFESCIPSAKQRIFLRFFAFVANSVGYPARPQSSRPLTYWSHLEAIDLPKKKWCSVHVEGHKQLGGISKRGSS